MGAVFIFLIGITIIASLVELIGYINTGKNQLSRGILLIVEMISIIIIPIIFLSIFDYKKGNDCCNDSAFFSPRHRDTLYILIALCIIAYGYSSFRKYLATPVIELVLNCFLIIGIILNIFIAIQAKEFIIWGVGNISIIALFLSQVYKNHQLILTEIANWDNKESSFLAKASITILRAKLFIKFPVLLIICLPLLLLISMLLLLVGQKPDSAIRAFTDTYKHGFSQLDYMCDNVTCGGHYLCSVAANGHPNVVKPERYGERNGSRIICNRQLLIANAFEELIEERFPFVHSVIRKKYNRVGNMVHRYYKIFNNKLFSDIIYFLMKPLEYFFLFVLYLFDRKPENRIALQYVNRTERERIQTTK
jgi:hypothetical protein